MLTGPCEGNIVDDSDDDLQLVSEPPSENFESDEVECAREKEGCLQLRPGGNFPQVDEERNDVQQVHVTDSGDNDSGRSRRTEFALTPTTTSNLVMRNKKKPTMIYVVY